MDVADFYYGVAAEAGDLDAKNKLAEKFERYRRASEAGDSTAMFNLAYCYRSGEGVERNWEEAFKWYRRSAEAGHLGAMNNLGGCYKEGKGVERSLEEAVKWFRRVADQGGEGAMWELNQLEENY